MQIRPATPADAPALAALAAETFPLACPPGTLSEDIEGFIRANFRPEQFAAHASDPERLLLVAESADSNGLTGYTLSNFGVPADPDIRAALAHQGHDAGPLTAEISKVYVRERAHGSGAAAALLSRTLREIRARGGHPVYLGVNQQNQRAQRFYVKHGFAVAGTKQFRVGAQTHDDYVLSLAPAGVPGSQPMSGTSS